MTPTRISTPQLLAEGRIEDDSLFAAPLPYRLVGEGALGGKAVAASAHVWMGDDADDPAVVEAAFQILARHRRFNAATFSPGAPVGLMQGAGSLSW